MAEFARDRHPNGKKIKKASRNIFLETLFMLPLFRSIVFHNDQWRKNDISLIHCSQGDLCLHHYLRCVTIHPLKQRLHFDRFERQEKCLCYLWLLGQARGSNRDPVRVLDAIYYDDSRKWDEFGCNRAAFVGGCAAPKRNPMFVFPLPGLNGGKRKDQSVFRLSESHQEGWLTGLNPSAVLSSLHPLQKQVSSEEFSQMDEEEMTSHTRVIQPIEQVGSCIQISAKGMDTRELKKKFGRDIVFGAAVWIPSMYCLLASHRRLSMR